jgi:hypothetical protein
VFAEDYFDHRSSTGEKSTNPVEAQRACLDIDILGA